jgi:hypothetical protein
VAAGGFVFGDFYFVCVGCVGHGDFNFSACGVRHTREEFDGFFEGVFGKICGECLGKNFAATFVDFGEGENLSVRAVNFDSAAALTKLDFVSHCGNCVKLYYLCAYDVHFFSPLYLFLNYSL